jgi:hypothetical protein
MFGDQRSKAIKGPDREAYRLSILGRLVNMWASLLGSIVVQTGMYMP